MSCAECYQGHVHEGTPRGKIIKLHGLDTYISEPSDGRQAKGIVVIISDAFGIEFVNSKLIADNYAEKGGYRVYLPDFMQGRSAPVWVLDKTKPFSSPGNYLEKLYNIPSLIYAMVPFVIFNRFGRTYPTVKGFFSALRRNEASSLPLGAVGFCWGGKHVALLAGDPEGQKLIDAAFTGHPSMLDVPADIKRVRVPVSIAVGDKDIWLSVKQAEQVKEIIEVLPEESRGEVVIYPGCGHGFCVRADNLNEDVAKQASEAEDQCIRWFEKHFGSETTT